MKLGFLARREPGPKAAASEWGSRDLPRPSAPVPFAAIRPIERFAPRIGAWASRSELDDTAAITTLADGAAWIWGAAARASRKGGGTCCRPTAGPGCATASGRRG